MYKFEQQLIIRKFIYDKIEEGYTVRKTGENINGLAFLAKHSFFTFIRETP